MSASQLDHIITTILARERGTIKLLDFGCGAGGLVQELLALGYDAYGCDLGGDWPEDSGAWQRNIPGEAWDASLRSRLRPITASPYRLPFADAEFDAVVSNSVLEHAQNKEELFGEISRVLKPNGIGVHFIPAKWRPIEPHIFVPFASWMWPHVPTWWLSLWAMLGVRNQFQQGLRWSEVTRLNRAYCRDGLHYWRLGQYRNLFRRQFGGYLDLERLRLECGTGRVARLTRTLRIGWFMLPMRAIFIEACAGHRNAHSELHKAAHA